MEDMLQEQDFDHIFDEDDWNCDSNNHASQVPGNVPLCSEHVAVSRNQPFFPVSPTPLREVSETSYSFYPLQPILSKTPSLTPKEAGISTWDDVSSIGTTSSRLAYLEPLPLPHRNDPIPSLIFVPTSSGNITARIEEHDDLEPLHVFPPTTKNYGPCVNNVC
jgi:hypothetical protein